MNTGALPEVDATTMPPARATTEALPERPWTARLAARFDVVWPPLLLIAICLVIWETYVRWRDVAETILPAPTVIVQSSLDDWATLRIHTWVTFQETIIGLGLAIVAALILGTAMDFVEAIRRGLYPILVSSQTIPIVAVAPLVIIWFGFGLFPKILIVAFYTFFPIVVGLSQGLASTEQDTMNLLRSMRANRWQIFWRTRFPSALPQFFTGLRITVTYAVVAAVFAEYVGAFEGLGIYMQQMRNAFRTDLVFGAVIVTMLLTLMLFLVVIIVERIAMPWGRNRERKERW